MNLPLIEVACPFNWEGRQGRRHCKAWGTVVPTVHGCKLRPDHNGYHICACGLRTK